MRRGSCLGCIFWVVFFMIIAVFVLIPWNIKRQYKSMKGETTATIMSIDKDVNYDDDGNRSVSYKYEYQYYVDGQSYRDMTKIGSSKLLNIGDRLNVHYNVNKPEKSVTEFDYELSKIFGYVSIVLGVVAVIILLMRRRRLRRGY